MMVKQKSYKPTFQRLLLPTVLILVVACLALAAMQYQALRQLDRTMRQASATAVEAIVDHEAARMALLAYDYSWWDEAVASLVSIPDPQWARDYIGSYLAETFELTTSLVVGPDGTTTFAFVDGKPTGADAGDILGPAAEHLVAEARLAPANEPEPVIGFVPYGDGLLLVAASAITPERLPVQAQDVPVRGVLMLGLGFPNDHVMEFAGPVGAADIAFRATPPPADRQALPLNGVDGLPVGYLAWTSETPGATLLEHIAVPIVIALLAAVGLVFIAFRNVSAVLDHEERLQSLLLAEQEFGDLQSRFIAMSTHRLRTPMSVIQAAAELISRYHDRMSSEDVVHEADAIIRSVGELDAMVVETTKLERHQLETDHVPTRNIRIEDLVAEIWGRREMPPPLEVSGSAVVHCDERRLRTVLTSILENAAKFSTGKGPVEVSIDLHGQIAVVRVKDHGIGIADQELGQLGIPFVRGSNVESYPGNGIGLAVAIHTLNWMGGSLEMESVLHEGTTVMIRLPAGEEIPVTAAGEQH